VSERCEETSSVLSVGETVTTKLQRIARKARSSPSFQFTSLFHLMDARLLRMCFERLRANAAAGIDQMTKERYAAEATERLEELVARLHRMSYRLSLPKTDPPLFPGACCFPFVVMV